MPSVFVFFPFFPSLYPRPLHLSAIQVLYIYTSINNIVSCCRVRSLTSVELLMKQITVLRLPRRYPGVRPVRLSILY